MIGTNIQIDYRREMQMVQDATTRVFADYLRMEVKQLQFQTITRVSLRWESKDRGTFVEVFMLATPDMIENIDRRIEMYKSLTKALMSKIEDAMEAMSLTLREPVEVKLPEAGEAQS